MAWTGVLLALLAQLGCGSGGSDSPAGGGSTASAAAGEAPAADPEERRLQLTRCLRDNGLDVSDPEPGSGRPGGGGLQNADPAERQAAFEACQKYATGADGEETSSDDQQQMLDYIRCLRGEGVDIADPDPNTGRPQEEDFPKLFDPDQEMRDAMKACERLRPDRLSGVGHP